MESPGNVINFIHPSNFSQLNYFIIRLLLYVISDEIKLEKKKKKQYAYSLAMQGRTILPAFHDGRGQPIIWHQLHHIIWHSFIFFKILPSLKGPLIGTLSLLKWI